jgi:hypothetical protein
MILFASAALAGCTMSTGVPGVPDIEIVPQSSAAQDACREYATAFNENTTRETVTAAVEAAQRTAAADTADPGAQNIAAAIDQVLTNTVMGTQETLAQANEDVLALCKDAGVNIVMEE